MNRLKKLFTQKQKNILNIYFTAGYPGLNDTERIILNLEKAGVDLIEIGMPYSDPLADGPTIQKSGQMALANGMTIDLLFEQIKQVRRKSNIPLILMGYFNQVMQYGEEAFIKKCKSVGIDGLILPDLPLDIYEEKYKLLFEKEDLYISFLMTPQTSNQRIQKIDELSTSFVYMVADASITGAKRSISEAQLAYFERIKDLKLKSPRLIGFGISDFSSYTTVCMYANGAIIGSAFIKAISVSQDLEKDIQNFVQKIKTKPEKIYS